MSLKTFIPDVTLLEIRKGILDTLFPLHCLGCDKKGFWLCSSCESSIPRRVKQSCPVCLKHITPYGQVCFECKDAKSSALDGIFAAAYYKFPLLKFIIHSYKYRFLSELSDSLANVLESELRKHDIPLPDTIIPVPLHKRRLRFRGFNQSELLAEHLATTLAPALVLQVFKNALVRVRYTSPQMKTHSKEERMKNLKNAFQVNPLQSGQLQGKNIWLIDDVATTGTTLEECATVLKKHGAKSVFGIVLAR